MKTKTTRTQVYAFSNNVKSAGYCELQTLLRNHEPDAYTSGIYGWNYDVYQLYGVTICTGYRYMPGERVVKAKEFEDRAHELATDPKMPYDERNEAIEDLLRRFCAENGGYEYESTPKIRVRRDNRTHRVAVR